MQQLSLTRPDDWHLHFRDGDMLGQTVAATARSFQRAIVMPNLVPPITAAAMARQYRQRILAARPKQSRFQPLMTLYLTDSTPAEELVKAKAEGVVAAKLYPQGATTNSAQGVQSLDALQPLFEVMAEVGLLLLIHGEVTATEVDIFDRERIFIEQHLIPLVEKNPGLKVVLEHITTKEAVEFVAAASANVAATITPQHLLFNRNHLLVGGVRPHNYCLPILKRSEHQQALRAAVATGSAKFFLGTDSAPHEKGAKESACGCAGCYSAPHALELYAEVFASLNALDKLEAFASFHGPDFYGLPRNDTRVQLVKQSWTVPERIELANGGAIVPFYAGRQLSWQLQPSS